jgi:hypothetical protein
MKFWIAIACLAAGCARETRRAGTSRDAGTTRVDAGFVADARALPDAGSFPGFDAGSFPGFDAGSFPGFDAGPPRRDAGRADAGPPRRDAGGPRLDAGSLPSLDGSIGLPCTSDLDCPTGRCCPVLPGIPFGLCSDAAVCPAI